MQADLGFSPENLSWVFNAYVVAFGGLLLLGGRLSDLFGARRMFAHRLAGPAAPGPSSPVSPAASASSWPAGPLQGAGAALIAPAALTLLMMLFGARAERTDQGAGPLRRGRAGRRHRRCVPRRRHHRVPVLAVGLLPQHPDRRRSRWPATPALMPAGPAPARGSVDVLGALTVTAGLGAAVYGDRPRPRGRLGLGADLGGARRRGRCCSAAFVAIQARPPRAAGAAVHLPRPEPRPPPTSPSSCSARPGSRCGSS